MRTRIGATLLLAAAAAASAATGGAVPAHAAPADWTTSARPAAPPPPAPPTAEEVRVAATVARPVVAPPRDPWRFSLRLPVWVPGLSGTLASGSSTLEGGGGKGYADRLFDAATDLQFAFTGGFTLSKGRWEVQADGFYVSVGTEVSFTLDDQPVLDAGLDALVAQGTVGYRLGRWGLGGGGRGPCLTATALAGVRYYAVGFWAETANRRVDRKADWADPLVGLRLDFELSRRFTLALRGDVGGFGVGSDLAWSAGAMVHWRFARHWQLLVGWNVLDMNYGFGTGDRHFEWDLHLSGPMVGIQYDF